MAALGDVCESRDNGFNFLRLAAAMGILIAHCMLVVPIETYTELGPNAGVRFAVDTLLAIFFVFSGFLIASSLERNCDLVRFYVARGLRIFPGLAVVAMVLAFVVGPQFSHLSGFEYFSSPDVWSFPFAMAVSLDQSASLPGLFATNPVADLVNMPIWTLRYEVALYLAFPIYFSMFLAKAGLLRVLGLIAPILAFIVTSSFAADIIPASLQNLLWFAASFMIGAGLWLYRKQVPNSLVWVLILALLFVITREMMFGKMLAVLAAGYTFIWLAFVKAVPLRVYNRFGDYSYGVYIIHFPVAQLVYQLDPTITPVALTFMTLLITLPLAVLLWNLIEKRCLGKVKQVSNAISLTIPKIGGHSFSR